MVDKGDTDGSSCGATTQYRVTFEGAYIFGSFGSAVERKGTKRTRNNLYYIYGLFGSAVDDIKEQMSQLVWWMINSGPVFCSLL